MHTAAFIYIVAGGALACRIMWADLKREAPRIRDILRGK